MSDKKKKSEEWKPEEWKPYKLRQTVQAMKDGDEWVVRDGDGNRWVVSKDEFAKHFKAI